VPITKPPTLGDVDFDDPEEADAFYAALLAEGRKRVQADIGKLQAMGLMDSEGNLLSTELPEDMREGSERDFGG
jgi:hypothetical protein